MKIPPQTPNTNRVSDSVLVGEKRGKSETNHETAAVTRTTSVIIILELSTPELSRTESKGAAGSNRFSALRDAPRHTRARGTGRRTSGNARKIASLRFVRRVRVPSTTANCLWEVATWVAPVGNRHRVSKRVRGER